MFMRTLLAIDDDKAWLSILAKGFTSFGYKVHTAATCSDAIKMVDSLRPACLLLDFHLDDGTAEDVCKFIKNDEKFKKTPVVIISGYEEEEVPSLNKCQADAFLRKPSTLAEIRVTVENLLRRVILERGISGKGDLRLEAVNFQVFRDSKPVSGLPPEQFNFLALLVDKSPGFVTEDEIAKKLFNSDSAHEKTDSIRGLAQRLRKNLGPQLGRRIKNKASLGWVYLQPRVRN